MKKLDKKKVNEKSFRNVILQKNNKDFMELDDYK